MLKHNANIVVKTLCSALRSICNNKKNLHSNTFPYVSTFYEVQNSYFFILKNGLHGFWFVAFFRFSLVWTYGLPTSLQCTSFYLHFFVLFPFNGLTHSIQSNLDKPRYGLWKFQILQGGYHFLTTTQSKNCAAF